MSDGPLPCGGLETGAKKEGPRDNGIERERSAAFELHDGNTGLLGVNVRIIGTLIGSSAASSVFARSARAQCSIFGTFVQ